MNDRYFAYNIFITQHFIIMLIREFYKGKVIAILGVKSIIGKFLINKIITQLSGAKKIYFIFKVNNFVEDVDLLKIVYNNKFYDETNSKTQLKELINKIQVVQLLETESGLRQKQQIQQIDIFFNCFIPCQPFYLQKSYRRNILFASKLIKFLKEKQPNTRFIALSTIYAQKPGYISEQIQQELTEVPKFTNLNNIQKYMEDNFITDYERWKLSVEILQNIYLKSKFHDVHVIRVPIVGSALFQLEGYSDKLNSLSLLVYQTGLGKINQLKGKNNIIIDLMPADFISNYMITIGALKLHQKSLYNLSTSSRNPLKLGRLVECVNNYWNENPLKENSHKVNLKIYEKSLTYDISQLKNRIPQFLFEKTSKIMELRGANIQNKKNKLIIKKKNQIVQKFSFYLNNEWISDANKSIDIFHMISPEERKIFNFNINEINWVNYINYYTFGIQKYILGLNISHYSSGELDLLKSKGNIYFADIYWALTEGKNYNVKSYAEIKRYVLSSKSVQQAIKQLIQSKTSKITKGTTSYGDIEKQYNKIANDICEQMFSQYSMKTLRFFAWFLNKVFKTIYQQVVIDKNSMMKLKALEEKEGDPIIFLPTHRSYIDFLIMSYIFFGYGIKCPHIAAAQDFLNMAIVHILLRKSGAFFIKRNQRQNRVLYKAIMTEYISKILCQNSHVEFFIEGTRSRVGKMLEPKYGILTIVAQTILNKKIPNARLVPITINYQRVLQGASFPFQLLGEPKVKQSLGRLIKAVDVLKENYGRIYIEICEPISMKKYFQDHKQMQPKLIINKLGYEIVHNLSDNLVVMPSAIVSSIILMQRKGISQEGLSAHVEWLCKQLHSKGVKIARTHINSSISVTIALNFLGDIVTKTKKNIFELDLTLNQESTNIFMLSYYRNTLTHIFFLQAIILTALNSFGYKESREQGVIHSALRYQVLFLYNMLSKQYILRDDLNNPATYARYISNLESKKIIITTNNHVYANQQASKFYSFNCSLIWPLVESYWLTILYLFNLKKLDTSIPFTKIVGQIQWFGQSMIQERVIQHYESISQDTIKNAISALSKLKIIILIKEEIQQEIVQSVKLNADQNKLKATEFHIARFLKSSYAKSVKGIVDSSRSTVMIDFPFLAKL